MVSLFRTGMKIIFVLLILALFLTSCTISGDDCSEKGGYVKGDIGDGSVMRERCGDEEFLGYIKAPEGGIEGSVCCKK
jgi:hypothetical protein